MAKLRAALAPRLRKQVCALGWVIVCSAACSVYDPSLLQGLSAGGAAGSSPAGSGGAAPGTGGERSGGTDAGGAHADGGQAPDPQGGTPAAGATSGTGGASGGNAPATGGAKASGGSSGGAPPATGGAKASGGSSGGTSPATGGAKASGGSSGGTSPATGGAKASGGSSGGAPPATGGVGGCGASDCCPDDPDKIAPGLCGCGVADQEGGSSTSCVGLRAALAHRYTFAGTGTRVTDSVGSAHATVVNATLSGSGALSLAGTTSDQYVDLPNGVLSALSDVTIEAWVTWSGGGVWQRIFDFGDSTSGSEGVQGSGNTYLFLTPRTGTTERCLRVAFSTSGSATETVVSSAAALPANRLAQLVVVVDDTRDQLSLYLDGERVGATTFTGRLSDIHDVNNWLGRSQFSADPELSGLLHELRIYDAALSADQIELSHRAGPDPQFL